MGGLKILIKNGATITAWNSDGMNALHIAVKNDSEKIVKVCTF